MLSTGNPCRHPQQVSHKPVPKPSESERDKHKEIPTWSVTEREPYLPLARFVWKGASLGAKTPRNVGEQLKSTEWGSAQSRRTRREGMRIGDGVVRYVSFLVLEHANPYSFTPTMLSRQKP